MFKTATSSISSASRVSSGKTIMRSYSAPTFNFKIADCAYALHIPKGVTNFNMPAYSSTHSKDTAVHMYYLMQLIRKLETAADNEYKKRNIRGFCHLYDGQEAVATGMEFALTKKDAIITAYRDHAHQILRGDTPKRVMAELFGKFTGCSKGKGGSMHMYLASNNFFGGNGIVGAQIPVGAGLAFGLKYHSQVLNKKEFPEHVAIALMGDGASNQGQVYEAYNMAKLWKLPALFVIEDNKYGMGTSVSRSSANTEYYTRGDYIPGIKVDGMDIFAVYEATKYAKEYALKNGPVVLQMETYRYHGHSMSDPGITYRTREEVKDVRTQRDPITKLRKKLLDAGVATEAELEAIDEKCTAEVEEAVEFSVKSPIPPATELISDIYLDKEYVVKGTSAAETYHYKAQ